LRGQGLNEVLNYLSSFKQIVTLFEPHLDLVQLMKCLLETFLLRDRVASFECSGLTFVDLSLSQLVQLPLNKE
jgi:hypothetical protein